QIIPIVAESVMFGVRLPTVGNRVLTGCACHPWRDYGGFERPQSRHPVEPFGPRKAMLFVCFADRASPMPRTPAALPATR
ncbi:MAG: hypothetical protein OXE54_06540, partial [Gammaproteobacteria bacterium]|nr:hypothetical protein [Gammaproteobacteria bacterium]